MANDEPVPQWRSFVTWGALGAVGYIVAVWGGSSLLNDKSIGELVYDLLRSKQLAAILGLGLIVATAVAGFTSRKRPVSLRRFRNFVIRDAVVLGAFMLFLWGVGALARAGVLGTMGASERVAAGTGAILVFFAALGTFVTATAQTSANLIDDELAADDMRERGRLFLCSFAWIAACGLLLIVQGLAGPGGVLPPPTALAGALILVAILAVLGFVTRRMSDELVRTLSYESSAMAFHLVLVFGGGWAMLAHLGFVAAPAPVDWLTLFTVLLFAASFIAVGRRKLLTP